MNDSDIVEQFVNTKINAGTPVAEARKMIRAFAETAARNVRRAFMSGEYSGSKAIPTINALNDYVSKVVRHGVNYFKKSQRLYMHIVRHENPIYDNRTALGVVIGEQLTKRDARALASWWNAHHKARHFVAIDCAIPKSRKSRYYVYRQK